MCGPVHDRRGTISVFNGPEPSVVLADSVEAEQAAVAAFVNSSLADGVRAEEIGVFVRTRAVIGRARDAVRSAGAEPFDLTLHKEGPAGAVRHLVSSTIFECDQYSIECMGCFSRRPTSAIAAATSARAIIASLWACSFCCLSVSGTDA